MLHEGTTTYMSLYNLIVIDLIVASLIPSGESNKMLLHLKKATLESTAQFYFNWYLSVSRQSSNKARTDAAAPAAAAAVLVLATQSVCVNVKLFVSQAASHFLSAVRCTLKNISLFRIL